MYHLTQLKALIQLSLFDLYRRKDLVVVAILMVVVLVPMAFATPFGVKGASRYLNEIALLLVWIFMLVISMTRTARIIPTEVESHTIYPLLSKPTSRTLILFGRYAGVLLASLTVLFLFYLLYAAINLLKSADFPWEAWLQALLLHTGFIVLATSLTLLGSLFMHTDANVSIVGIIVVGMLLYGQHIPTLITEQTTGLRFLLKVIYWIAPHCEFFDLRTRLIHHWPPIPWLICFAACAYALVYSALCFGIAAWVFNRKKV
jgi:ABC-type transport system involved in multi-copper enzyme maturation permease subunit